MTRVARHFIRNVPEPLVVKFFQQSEFELRLANAHTDEGDAVPSFFLCRRWFSRRELDDVTHSPSLLVRPSACALVSALPSSAMSFGRCRSEIARPFLVGRLMPSVSVKNCLASAKA